MVVIEDSQGDIIIDVDWIRMVCAQHFVNAAAHKSVDNAVVFTDFTVNSKNAQTG